MRPLLLLPLLVVALALPGAAGAAACSPLDCAPSQFPLAHGSLVGFRATAGAPVSVVDLSTGALRWRLPAGIVGDDRLVHQSNRVLTWYDAATGAVLHSVTLTRPGRLVGVSQDGSRAVVVRRNATTTMSVVSPAGVRAVALGRGNWDFDALRGDNLFLIRYVPGGGYQVRLAHPGTGTLEPRVLKDPHESGIIWGQPYSRLPSADGRFLFTLYIGSNGGAMIHELDLDTATARCIDLPGTGDYGSATSWALTLSHDGRTLWAVSPGYGRAVAIDVATRTVASAFSILFPRWNLGLGTRSALSPDGTRLALADGARVAVVDLQSHRLLDEHPQRALGVAYSPAGDLLPLG